MAEPTELNSIIQEVIDTRADMQSFNEFMNAAKDVIVARRLASGANTLDYYLDYLNAIKLVFTQASGDVTVGDKTVKSISQLMLEAALTLEKTGGNIPYPTYAAMVADKANITNKMILEVTNDTDQTKNGKYTYDGVSVFTKSNYDVLALAKAHTDAAETSAVATAGKNAKLEIAKKTINTLQTSSPNLHEWADSDGGIVMSLESNGALSAEDFKTPNGSVADVVNSFTVRDMGDYAHVFTDNNGDILWGLKTNGMVESANSAGANGLAEMRAGILSSEEMNELGMALDKKELAKPPLNMDVEVAPYESDGTIHQRMPSAIKLSDNLLYVAFAQFSLSGHDDRDGRLVGRFVNYDLDTKTSSVGLTRVIDGEKTGTLSRHPVFIELKDRIVLMFNAGTDLVQMESFDRCQTWTNRRSIKLMETPAYALGLDTAVQIQHGKYAGRVCLAIYSAKNDVAIMYSDDDCVTWKLGAQVNGDIAFPQSPALTEPSIALDSSQNLVLVIRNETSGLASRNILFAKSRDGGQTLEGFGMEPLIISSQCQMGIKQFAPTMLENVPKILLSHPTTPSFSRKAFRLRLSYDNCNSFVATYAPFSDTLDVAYSSICILDNSTFALLYEEGVTNRIQSIKIKFLNLAEIF